LLAEFVRQADAGSVEPRLIQHIRHCFAAYLAGEKKLLPAPESKRRKVTSIKIPTLEKAFGLARPDKGRAPLSNDMVIDVALAVLRFRLRGMTFEKARDDTAKIYHKSSSRVGECWARGKREALDLERVSRAVNQCSWSNVEMNRLRKIYSGEVWFVPPGNNKQFRV
jgi:hypothetical protein